MQKTRMEKEIATLSRELIKVGAHTEKLMARLQELEHDNTDMRMTLDELGLTEVRDFNSFRIIS
jgi:regulator of replication initiation timing